MFYWLHLLENVFSPLRIFRYITVRTVAAAGTAFLLSILLGPWMIEQLRKLKIGQYIRTNDPNPLHPRHEGKKGTPTMGGVLIIFAIVVSTLLWAIPGNGFTLLVLCTLCYMGAVGFWDDYTKIRKKQSKGLSARAKFLLQGLWALTAGWAVLTLPETATTSRMLMVPFLSAPAIQDIGVVCALILIALIMVGASNAVNLTDGLDGLAIGCSSSVALAYLVISYVAGRVDFADYLRIPYVAGAGELSVFCGAMMGASLGFLWYNCHPASVFMGDTGSLALGGSMAMVAILVKHELVLMIVGGVFVLEALSVIIQVGSFKLRGKRVFAMAPLHHHFEKRDWSETQVVVRFWILSIIFALLGVLTLKIR